MKKFYFICYFLLCFSNLLLAYSQANPYKCQYITEDQAYDLSPLRSDTPYRIEDQSVRDLYFRNYFTDLI